MRDLERWKDKVELSLDGRQIFFLFFGSAVAACLIFVAGMMVGRRVERRNLAATPTVAEDPLAALDQLSAADEDDGLTFPRALAAAGDRRGHRAEDRVRDGGPHEASKPAAKVELAKGEPVKPPAPRLEPAPPEPVRAEPAVSPAPVAPAPKVAAPAAKPSAPVVKLAPPAAKPSAPVVKLVPPVAKPAAPDPKEKTHAKPGEHYTLQLAAFPDKADADQFLAKMQADGYKPFLVQSDVPGRGIYYRVRVGDYGSKKAVETAKAEFERKHHQIAYVSRL